MTPHNPSVVVHKTKPILCISLSVDFPNTHCTSLRSARGVPTHAPLFPPVRTNGLLTLRQEYVLVGLLVPYPTIYLSPQEPQLSSCQSNKHNGISPLCFSPCAPCHLPPQRSRRATVDQVATATECFQNADRDCFTTGQSSSRPLRCKFQMYPQSNTRPRLTCGTRVASMPSRSPSSSERQKTS